jgi:hypothetical protein
MEVFMDDLEQAKVEAEPKPEVSVTEPKIEVSPQPTAEVSGEKEQPKTFKQEDLDKLVADKEKEWQSRKDRELSELQNKVGELDKRAKLAELAVQEKRELETWGDTAEVKQFQDERRKFTEIQNSIIAEKARIETLANQTNMTARMMKAREIVSENPGMDVHDLLKCKTPEEMTDLVGIYKKIEAKFKSNGKEGQKLDSSVPVAPGVDTSKLKGREAIAWGIKNQQK